MDSLVQPTPAGAGVSAPLNSANAGFIVHRTGQLEYAFAAEGRQFSAELVQYLNRAQPDVLSASLFTEVAGVRDRVHWFVHLRSPHDYQRLLQMVDLDRDYQDISTRDRLPARGGGNWERMFTAGSFAERVLCPQHGFGHPPEGAVDPAVLFADPACYQTTQPLELQLSTADAGAVVLRTGKARYEHRDAARQFAVAWADALNAGAPGQVTAFLYEEIFGRQDTLHWLIHLRALDDYALLDELGVGDPRLGEVLARRWVAAGGGGGWGELFVPGSLRDVAMVPHPRGAG
ncbi:MAG: hypothetical protein HY241_12330 [Actinobacteria bacterium]|nr:hypothetical protein [Actinomycetota bacterium]